MLEPKLRDRRVLIVEDEYMIADEMRSELGRSDAIVIGPVGTVQAALDLIRSEPLIDCVILDLNLGGEMAFPVADLLMERGTPFLFVTGYDRLTVPAQYDDVIRCEKPVSVASVTRALVQAIQR